MKLLFLHGSPATGKLTTARALLRMVPGRLMDNHAVIDFVRTIFDFDAPGFWPLIHDVRYSALDAAAANGVPLLVTTFCYAEPEDREQFGKFEVIMQRHGGELLPVFLHCSREEAMRRVGNPDRVERRKMASGEALANYLDSNNFTAGTAGRLPEAGYRRCPGGSDRAENRRSFRAHTSIDLTEAAASRRRGRKRSIISADDTRSTCAPMLMAATMTPS